MKAITIRDPGRDYRLLAEDQPQPVPGPGEILIRVAAAGLNRADLLQARGKYPPPPGASPLPGLEVSGAVAALGAGVTEWTVGRRVCALLPGGGYAELAVADAGSVLPVPDGVALEDAAGLPEAAFTAWTNIMDTGRLAPGETLLVHGGTSGIGSLAIQVFAARGHRVFTTVGSDEKCATARALGAAHAINYRREDFVAAVQAQTGGRGVDVILDMVGGGYVQRNIAAAAPGGRIVNIAYQDGFRTEVDFAPVLAKRLTLSATTLRGRTAGEKRAIRDALLRHVWPLLGTGIKPLIDRIFPLVEAGQAHAALSAGGHSGKILLSLDAPGG